MSQTVKVLASQIGDLVRIATGYIGTYPFVATGFGFDYDIYTDATVDEPFQTFSDIFPDLELDEDDEVNDEWFGSSDSLPDALELVLDELRRYKDVAKD